MPSAPDPSTTISRRRAVIVSLVLFASFAYFYEGGGWNQNTRFDLVRAILETRTVRIDLYHENTGDKAHVGSHYYMDKAPGASLIAVPPVGAARAVMRLAGAKLYSREAMVVYSYVATLAAAALPAAIAGWCVFWIGRRFGADDSGATLAAIACGLGTPLWAYATIFYGHALAAGCLAVAYVGSLRLGDSLTRQQTTRIALVVGLAAGWSVVTEYPASIPAGVLVLYAAWLRWKREPSSFARTSVAMGAGLAFGAIVLLGYNWLAFGKPLYIGYTSETEGYAAMRTGIFGVNLPTWDGTYGILFGAYRGLLPLAPVVAIAPVGFWFLLRDARTRNDAAIGGFVALYYFLLTAGYAYWSGGWSYGSRHLGPALPFLCLGLAPIWMRTRRVLRAAVVVLALVGVGESLVAVATTPQPPVGAERPMAELLWPAFKSGDFPIGWQGYLDLRPPDAAMSELEAAGVPRAAWNLGQLAGLRAFASLLPLLALWLAGAVAWTRAHQRSTIAQWQSRD
jgi:hypothetical protein